MEQCASSIVGFDLAGEISLFINVDNCLHQETFGLLFITFCALMTLAQPLLHVSGEQFKEFYNFSGSNETLFSIFAHVILILRHFTPD